MWNESKSKSGGSDPSLPLSRLKCPRSLHELAEEAAAVLLASRVRVLLRVQVDEGLKRAQNLGHVSLLFHKCPKDRPAKRRDQPSRR